MGIFIGQNILSVVDAAQTLRTYTFNGTDLNTLLADDFRDGVSNSNFSYSSNTGLTGSAAVSRNNATDVWTTRQSYSTPATNEVITVAGYFKNESNNGYGLLGISPKEVNSIGSSGNVSRQIPIQGMGVLFHGGGGNFFRNGSSVASNDLSWTDGDLTNDWWYMKLQITSKGNFYYDITFEIYPSDIDGNLGTLKTTHTLTDVYDSYIGQASSIKAFFGMQEDRFSTIDDFSVEATQISDPVIVAPFSGAGTEMSPYQIDSCEKLQAIDYEDQFRSAYYTMTANIDCAATDPSNGSFDANGPWRGQKGFDPIGDESSPFTGVFDGAGNTISNLYINRADDDESVGLNDEQSVAIFGYIQNSTVKNLNVINSKVKGYNFVGGIIGYIDHSTSTNLSFNAGLANNSCNPGSCVWMVGGDSIGGVVGYSLSSYMADLVAGGPIKGFGSAAGGIVGTIDSSTLERATSSVFITSHSSGGGIVGAADFPVITNVNASGTITLLQIDGVTPGHTAGGIVGVSIDPTISSSTANVNITGGNFIGGFIGNSSGGNFTANSATGNVSGADQVGGFVGAVQDNQDNQNTIIYTRNSATGNVEGEHNVGGFIGYYSPSNGDVTSSFSYLYSTGNVTVASSTSNPSAFGGFAGSLDYINIENSYTRSNVYASGADYVGGFVGTYNPGSLSKAYATGIVTGATRVAGFSEDVLTGDDLFWDTDTTGIMTSGGGGFGKTTSEMKTLSTYTDAGWDFTNTWAIDENINDGYPYLLWQTATTTEQIAPLAISTLAASSISESGVTLNGNITATGTSQVTARGFNYGLTTGFGSTVSSSGNFIVGNYSNTISSLTCNTLYYFRAFAANSEGTTYGSNMSFTTSACPVVSSGGGSYHAGGCANCYVAPQSIVSTTTNSSSTYSVSTLSKYTFKFLKDLKTGSINSDVKELQKFLNSNGYILAASGPGSIGNETDTFGKFTREALARFQAANKISPAVGFFGPITRTFINSKN